MERVICEPVVMNLFLDAHQLSFSALYVEFNRLKYCAGSLMIATAYFHRRLAFVSSRHPTTDLAQVSLPANCLYRLRVWLRTGQVDHRLFAEDDLWIGKDPDFRTIALASFAQFTSGAPFMLVYQGFVGKAQVAFIVRCVRVTTGMFGQALLIELLPGQMAALRSKHIRDINGI